MGVGTGVEVGWKEAIEVVVAAGTAVVVPSGVGAAVVVATLTASGRDVAVGGTAVNAPEILDAVNPSSNASTDSRATTNVVRFTGAQYSKRRRTVLP
ncbi:MAG: hypothetical protein PVSMB7_05220 [Chloroflexota bacterium]